MRTAPDQAISDRMARVEETFEDLDRALTSGAFPATVLKANDKFTAAVTAWAETVMEARR